MQNKTKNEKNRTKVSEVFTSIGELCMIKYNYVYFQTIGFN